MHLPSILLASIYFWNTVGNFSSKSMFAVTVAALSTTAAATSTVRVRGSGVEGVNTDFEWTSATIIPPGFERVCVNNGWGVRSTWEMLNNGKPWLRASNEAYIYLNDSDGQWWIDKPDGNGVYIAPEGPIDDCGSIGSPPVTGWRSLFPSYDPVPSVEILLKTNEL
mmetsp:Transcript_3448/g.7535  ORF Transcript_3448/g.7535 Transcript_3448/m.7535 type:complete len:166 (+) Transcript_3448:187-684(+)